MARLTKTQQSTLKKHSVHHSQKHMTEMRKAMREGSTFTAAHKKAMKKVGKQAGGWGGGAQSLVIPASQPLKGGGYDYCYEYD